MQTVPFDAGVWATTRSLAPSVAMVAGIAYGLYLFYKRYIEPILFGRQKHPFLIIQESVDKLTQSMDSLRDSINSMESNIKKQIEDDLAVAARSRSVEMAAVNDIKAEVISLKALLLNREQFPAAPKLIKSASIPTWQLSDDVKASSPRET